MAGEKKKITEEHVVLAFQTLIQSEGWRYLVQLLQDITLKPICEKIEYGECKDYAEYKMHTKNIENIKQLLSFPEKFIRDNTPRKEDIPKEDIYDTTETLKKNPPKTEPAKSDPY